MRTKQLSDESIVDNQLTKHLQTMPASNLKTYDVDMRIYERVWKK